jgi:hypothetical protein|tara:strand:- start:11 stop:598 length:588 start_codon:yes stop_codon:yes gene_type:complete
MANLAQRWESQSPSDLQKRSVESMKWFRDKARNLKVRPKALQKGLGTYATHLQQGKMYMFFYNAKWQDKLPYWDRFPCMIPLDVTPNKVLGINLHYIAPRHRLLLLDELFKTTTSSAANEEFDTNTRFRVFYDLVKSVSRLKYAKPCLKSYFSNRIVSRITEVPTNSWEIVGMMPTAQWQKEHANHVYAESRKKF